VNQGQESVEEWERSWSIRGRAYRLGLFPWLMGIVNATPDSFSDGGQFFVAKAAVDWALKLAADGADVLDIGGESTRPGSEPVDAREELRRVIPVIEGLRDQTDRLISIDTTKAVVAREAIAAGADIVNDVSGCRFDTQMPAVCAESNVGVIVMHMLGTPQTMQKNPEYGDVVREVITHLEECANRLIEAGCDRERILFDPGIGFGKTPEHNVELLANVGALRATGRPVLIGHSRKQFLKKLLGRPVEERLCGTLGVAIAVAQQRADMIRVHDVRETRDTLIAWHAVSSRIVQERDRV
jgi:dihydropteroate synthase